MAISYHFSIPKFSPKLEGGRKYISTTHLKRESPMALAYDLYHCFAWRITLL